MQSHTYRHIRTYINLPWDKKLTKNQQKRETEKENSKHQLGLQKHSLASWKYIIFYTSALQQASRFFSPIA